MAAFSCQKGRAILTLIFARSLFLVYRSVLRSNFNIDVNTYKFIVLVLKVSGFVWGMFGPVPVFGKISISHLLLTDKHLQILSDPEHS